MFRPLLAEAANLKTLVYPVFASPKYDGFRCVIDGIHNPVSRNLKPIANIYTFGKLKELGLPKIDGELLTFTNDKVDDFDTVQSKLTTRAGMPDFRYMVFDQYMITTEPYIGRYAKLQTFFQHNKFKNVRLVEQKLINNEEELLDYEAECLKQGWEGVMVRSVSGPYKMGRSTTKEGILLKLKRFFDAEATILATYEFMHNANESIMTAMGPMRSSHQANMVPMNKLGGFHVKWNDVEFDVGTGFNESQRNEYWSDEVVGKTIKFKYQSVGSSGKPRFPVFLGFRPDADMD
jgi:DNA ligase-1